MAIKSGTEGIASVTDIAAEGAKAVGAEQIGQTVDNVGDKIRAVGDSIVNHMNAAHQSFSDHFDKYIKNSYSSSSPSDAAGNSFYSVILPMPNELTDTHQHNMDNLMLGLLPRAASALGVSLSVFSEGMSRRSAAIERRNQGDGSFAASAIGATLSGLGSVGREAAAYAIDNARARLGVGINPNVETIYSAPSPRIFNFTFQLYIKSRDEARLVKEFINKLKQHSYPLSVLGIGGQNQLFLYPGEVYFEFSGRYRSHLFRSLRPCIITNINVQYSDGQNQYHHFDDGSSIVYIVTITLTETRLLDRNILADDEKEYARDAFSDEKFRSTISTGDTFLGKEFRDAVTNPQQVINNMGRNFFGVEGDLVPPLRPSQQSSISPPPQSNNP
jgi:hypothetical protein